MAFVCWRAPSSSRSCCAMTVDIALFPLKRPSVRAQVVCWSCVCSVLRVGHWEEPLKEGVQTGFTELHFHLHFSNQYHIWITKEFWLNSIIHYAFALLIWSIYMLTTSEQPGFPIEGSVCSLKRCFGTCRALLSSASQHPVLCVKSHLITVIDCS